MDSNIIGQVFTPNYIAEFMVKNSLVYCEIKDNLKILEPSVGKGVFLTHLTQNNLKNIVAYEIDLNLKPVLQEKFPKIDIRFENVLGSDLNEKFDLIIGNPPYLGQNYNAEIFQDYVKKYPICEKFFVGNMDLFYYFIHVGIEKLKPGGILSYITTNYWITKSKKTGIKFLKPHILEECFLLQYIDLSKLTLFKGAEGQHNCIFVLQKKTEQEKKRNVNKPIDVIQIDNIEPFNLDSSIFTHNNHVKKYQSALTNHDLKRDRSWNLLYPEEVKEIVDEIEKNCTFNGKISYLKDLFIVRNGLIFIKDDIFILNEGKNLKIENQDFYIKIKDSFLKILNAEKNRLKKIYKSKSIKSYGYIDEDHIGYAIYFNKSEFKGMKIEERNRLFEEKYPTLTGYLNQYKTELKDILINAKENPKDNFFPRRGTFIRRNNDENLTDLEPFYENANKIFFKYISNENSFGFSDSPYFATSDTYFLWPKIDNGSIDYLFILGYLNSKLVQFLFKAKNLRIKRSKTKLEDDLPLLNAKIFTSASDLEIISSIKSRVSQIIQSDDHITTLQTEINMLFLKLFKLNHRRINELMENYY
jgi:adenine-specific DNA-methyltransferase